MRSRGAAAILIGATAGVTLALIRQPDAATPPSPTPSSAPSPPSATAAAPTTPAAAPLPLPPPAPPSASAPSPFPFPPDRSPLTTLDDLKAAEVRCYESDPEECGRAARAYDSGVLVPRDRAHAADLAKIELTRLKRKCEQRSPHACLVLAARQFRGDGVPKDEKRALALLVHARDLCAKTPAECANGEPR